MKKKSNRPPRFREVFTKEDMILWRTQDIDGYLEAKQKMETTYSNWHYNYTRTDFRNLRCWVLLRRYKKTGKLEAQIENSFSMSWSDTVARVHRPSIHSHSLNKQFTLHEYRTVAARTAISLKIEADVLNKNTDGYEYFVARVGSAKCPITIDWNRLYNTKPLCNFDYRNLYFKEK